MANYSTDSSSVGELIKQKDCPPLVFCNIINDWPSSKWTPEHLANQLSDEKFTCKIAPQGQNDVLWETECVHTEVSLNNYVEWLREDCKGDNPLKEYNLSNFSCYIDYKYMKDMFKSRQELLKDVDWSVLGLTGRNGQQSTIWIGSKGCYTNCHYDTYGFNLIAQIYGRKKWTIFPFWDTDKMYPSRIPYEESSVFSQVNVKNPDLKKYPQFESCHPYIIVLEPGQVLYLPRHWWHFVESVESSISINTWVDVEEDNHSRLEEAIGRLLFSTFVEMKEDIDGADSTPRWINPGEELTDKEENIVLLEAAYNVIAKQQPISNRAKYHVTENYDHVFGKSNDHVDDSYDHVTEEQVHIIENCDLVLNRGDNFESFCNFFSNNRNLFKAQTCLSCLKLHYCGKVTEMFKDDTKSKKVKHHIETDEFCTISSAKRQKLENVDKSGNYPVDRNICDKLVFSLLPLNFHEYMNTVSYIDNKACGFNIDDMLQTNQYFCQCEKLSSVAENNSETNYKTLDIQNASCPVKLSCDLEDCIVSGERKVKDKTVLENSAAEDIDNDKDICEKMLFDDNREGVSSLILEKLVKCLLHPTVIKRVANLMKEDTD